MTKTETNLIEADAHLSAAQKHTPTPQLSYSEMHDSSCGTYCSPNGCRDDHPSGYFELEGIEWDWEASEAYGFPVTRDEKSLKSIVRACNAHDDLVTALAWASEEVETFYNASKSGLIKTEITIGMWSRLRRLKDILAKAQPGAKVTA